MNDFTELAKPLDTYVADFAARQEAFAELLDEENPPVHYQRLGLPEEYPDFQKVPRSIYFYYLSVSPNGGLDVRHYFYPGGNHAAATNPAQPGDWPAIPNNDAALVPIVQKLIDNAKGTVVDNQIALIGRGFQGIEWYRKSYVVLFIDEENWSLHRDSTSGRSAILFVTEPQGGNPGGTPNRSFFDGRTLNIPVPNQPPMSAFVFINHMKRDAAGADLLANDRQRYVFKLYFSVKFTTGEPPMTVIFDPDGTNLGPPLPPP